MYNNLTSTPPSTQSQPTYARAANPLPTKKQALLLPSDEGIPLFNYILAVGRQIGPSNILTASKISKQLVCIYLSTE